jgi:hypothetical protein
MFRLRTPANVLAAGATGKRIRFDFPAFLRSEPLLVRTTVGAEIKFSLRTRNEEVAEFRRNIALAELNKFFAAVRRGPQPFRKCSCWAWRALSMNSTRGHSRMNQARRMSGSPTRSSTVR